MITLGARPRAADDPHPDRAVVALTRLPGAALSVDYLEPRVRAYADLRSAPHPEFPAASSLDFTHER